VIAATWSGVGGGPSYPDRVKTRESRELREVKPLDLPMTPFAVGGLALWLVAALILLPMRDTLAAQGRENWFWICVAGFAVGLPGLAQMIRHDRRRRRRAAEVPPSEIQP
jgi:hypothetical protein